MPNLDNLSELEYIYYLVGYTHFKKEEQKNKQELSSWIVNEASSVINNLNYELADLKALLFDLSSGLRGLGGVKQPFKLDDLPSYRARKQKELEPVENETLEEKRLRHEKFFNELKATFKNK